MLFIPMDTKVVLVKFRKMTAQDRKTLLNECLKVLQYYIDKTEAVRKLYQDTAETQYFLSALKGTMTFIAAKEEVDIPFLNRCLDGLIAGQKGRTEKNRLTDLRLELKEELKLLKLRYDLK